MCGISDGRRHVDSIHSEKSFLFDHVDPISDFLWIPKPIFPFDDSEKSFDDSEKSFRFDALQ